MTTTTVARPIAPAITPEALAIADRLEPRRAETNDEQMRRLFGAHSTMTDPELLICLPLLIAWCDFVSLDAAQGLDQKMAQGMSPNDSSALCCTRLKVSYARWAEVFRAQLASILFRSANPGPIKA